MAKVKNDYFKMVEQQVEYCVKASDYLQEILGNYSEANLPEQRDIMHDIEHKADEIHHDILRKLSAEFITPIDQEDILSLVQIIDDRFFNKEEAYQQSNNVHCNCYIQYCLITGRVNSNHFNGSVR